jgi:hypothetical protein
MARATDEVELVALVAVTARDGDVQDKGSNRNKRDERHV